MLQTGSLKDEINQAGIILFFKYINKMAKTTKPLAPKINSDGKADEFATKVFAKSDSPKTVKETIKLVINLLINFPA